MKGRFFLVFCVDLLVAVSGVIGAGFATGQEILLYFYGKNPFVVCCACFIFFSLFIFACSTLNTERLSTAFGVKSKTSFWSIGNQSKFLLHFSCFVILCAMLGGAQTNADMVFKKIDFKFWGVLMGVACVILCRKELVGIKILSVAVGPLMIAAILIVCCLSKNTFYNGNFTGSISNSLFYVSMNTVSMCGVLNEMGKKYSFKQKAVFAMSTALLLSILIFFAVIMVNAGEKSIMPLVEAAMQLGVLGKIYGAVVMFSILTTVCTSAYPLIKSLNKLLNNGLLSALTVVVIAFVFSLVGFETIVTYCYPAISVFGILLALLTIIAIFKQLQVEAKKHRHL